MPKIVPPRLVVELVERFQRNESAYNSGQYNEAQIRAEFIDPLFEALGWDVRNSSGAAEAYKDVINEDAIKIAGGTKAPDYCFRIGGTRKFFVEAKKPAIRIGEDQDAAFQLRRYAWSSNLPLSVLTNFAEFAAYDCRVKPFKTDKASKARVLLIKYSEFLENWGEVSEKFSKDAILKGFFDKFAESTKLKKGTARVDDAFLEEIEAWRKDLASHIALRNSNLSRRELNEAIQRIIDRIIFLRISEDRGIEAYGQLRDLASRANVYQQLCQIFQRADERYNSGLFHFLPEKGRAEPPDQLTLSLRIDDDRLKPILRGLYYPESPYEFSVLPGDILGQVYEQFLGSVIVLSPAHRATVDYKPEAKKAGGVFYTPSYVVEFIVEGTVGKLLDGKTPRQAAKLRILDPACGSGSFLLGAYQHLLAWHREWYLANGGEIRYKQLYKGAGGEWHLTIEEKKRILLNNIYGVDIDPQAVEVTKLSLLLKVLEGESEQTLNTTLRLFHERALPDLGDNVKCGNSLIGPDFYKNRQLHLLDEDERWRINAFDWSGVGGYLEIMTAGGFDAVIGNPPWGGNIDKELPYYHAHYPATTQDHTDSFKLFIEAGVRLTKEGGFTSMIVPSTILRQRRLIDVRRLLLAHCLRQTVDLGEDIFKRVVAPSCIFVLEKETPSRTSIVHLRDLSRVSDLERPKLLLSDKTGHDSDAKQTDLLKNEELELAVTLTDASGPIRQLGQMREFKCKDSGINYQRVKVGMQVKGKGDLADRLLYEGAKQRSNDQMFWKGSDIAKYWIEPSTQRFCRPDIRLRNNEVVHLSSKVYNTVPKILLRQTADTPIAALDERGVWFGRSIIAITKVAGEYNIEYLLGILNSAHIRQTYEQLVHEKGRVFAQVKLSKLKQLPIRAIDFSDQAQLKQHNQMVDLVRQVTSLVQRHKGLRSEHERTLSKRQIDLTESRIDELVGILYGLK